MSQHWTRLQIRARQNSPIIHSLEGQEKKMPEDIPVEYYNTLRDMLPGASYLSSDVEIVNATIDYIQALEHIL